MDKAEALRKKIAGLKQKRTSAWQPDNTNETTAPAGKKNLLTKQDKKRMAREVRKKGVNGILEQFGVTDPILKRKVLDGMNRGLLGSYQELQRFIESEKKIAEAEAKAPEIKEAALDLPETKLDNLPSTSFKRAKLRPPGSSIATPNDSVSLNIVTNATDATGTSRTTNASTKTDGTSEVGSG